jgi:hypothetical protein
MVSQFVLTMVYFGCITTTALLIIVLLKHSYFVLWTILLMNILSIGALVAFCAYRARLAFEIGDIFAHTT